MDGKHVGMERSTRAHHRKRQHEDQGRRSAVSVRVSENGDHERAGDGREESDEHGGAPRDTQRAAELGARPLGVGVEHGG